MVKISFVTGTRNRPDAFRRLVESLKSVTIAWELIAADASEEPVGTANLPANLLVIPERPRLGMARGYNAAFEHASGEWVIWLNDDCTLDPGCAENAIRFMEEHPEIGLGAIYYSDKMARRDYHVNVCCYGMLYANFGILKREFGNQLGWFDAECCPMYGSDNTLAYRVLLAGKGIASIPASRITHHSEDDDCRRQNNYGREQDSYTLKGKYGPLLPQMKQVYEEKGNICKQMA
jgi:GT2 family glycosyltransferase